MMYINNKFQAIQITGEQDLKNIINSIKEFIINNIDDENIVLEIINECDNILIQYTDGMTYSIIAPDNNVRNMDFIRNAGAFKINMVINLNDSELNIQPGICLRPNYTINQFVHEMLHAVSSKQNILFDQNGIAYTKTGTKIEYYDKNLNDSNVYANVSSDGLNEGLTEYYTSILMKKNSGSYPYYVVLADILNKNSNCLVKAYFSRDIDDLLNFYQDLEAKQGIINREDLITLSSKEVDEERSYKLLEGAIKYNLASSNKEELENNLEYIKNKLEYLDQVSCLDNGSWTDILNNSIIQETNYSL